MKSIAGLSTIAVTTMFERFSFYSLMSVFYFMLQEKFGLMGSEAGMLYSSMYAVLFIMPLILGLVADFTNRRLIITLGIISLIIGYGLFSLIPMGSIALIGIPMLFISLGTGAFKPNIPVLIGNLVKDNDKGSYIAFIAYYTFINIGAFFAPLITMILKESYGFEAVFLMCSGVMIIALLIFLLFKKTYIFANDTFKSNKALPDYTPVRKRQNRIVLTVLLIMIFPIYAAYNQTGLTLNFFTRDYILNGGDIAASIQSINPLTILITSGIISLILFFLIKTKNFILLKIISIGLLIAAIGYFIPVAALIQKAKDLNIGWIYSTIITISIAEILISPLIVFGIYRSAPKLLKGLFIALIGIVTATANMVLFLFATIYESVSPMACFILVVVLLVISSAVLFIFNRVLQKKKTETETI